MAKVSFLTIESTTPGETSGCDGFPYPLNFTSPDSIHPIPVSFDNNIYWHWRVKNWTLATDISVTDSVGTTVSLYNGALDPQGNALDETGLMNPIFNHQFDVPIGQPGAMSLSLFAPSADQIRSDSGLLYPHILVSGNVSAGLASVSFSTVDPGGAASFSITVDSEPMTLYYVYIPDPGGSSFTASSLVLTPSDFWAYS